MASNDRWSSTLGLVDVIACMNAIEAMNECTVVVRLLTLDMDNRYGPWLTAEAYVYRPEGGVLRRLGSARLLCTAQTFSAMDTAVFRLLHMLDGDIAAREMSSATTPKA